MSHSAGHTAVFICATMILLSGCGLTRSNPTLRLITLDPGHFHAALVQKSMYANIDPVVHVYAPDGDDLAEHLKRIDAYNKRTDNPTRWQEVVYKGPDYLEKMVSERAGNLVVISGNNSHKGDYILKSVQAGFHVLADKPMAINSADLEKLKQAFGIAATNHVMLYDIMTERFEVTNALQRELSQNRLLFGELVQGSASQPAIEMDSVHYFSKIVSGAPLKRPAWFFDVRQQGTGITDVATHLVDLAQGITAGERVLSPADVSVQTARRWPTALSKAQFEQVTGLADFPEYLRQDVRDDALQVSANGEFTYQLKGTWIKIVARWDYQARAGGDTHNSIARGSKANLIIRQGAEQGYRPVLYIEKAPSPIDDAAFAAAVKSAVDSLQKQFPGVAAVKDGAAYRVTVPESLAIGHEAHFAQVTNQFLNYIERGLMPSWEIGAMLTKYTTVIQADELSRK